MDCIQKLELYEKEKKPYGRKMIVGTIGVMIGLPTLSLGMIINGQKNLENILIISGASLLTLSLPVIYSNAKKITQLNRNYFEK